MSEHIHQFLGGDEVEAQPHLMMALEPHKDTPRYQVMPQSQSGHCCFEATVVDVKNPMMFGDEHYRDGEGYLRYEHVCECFDVEDALKIAAALEKTCEPET